MFWLRFEYQVCDQFDSEEDCGGSKLGAEAGSMALDPIDNLLKNDMRFNSSFGAAKMRCLYIEKMSAPIVEDGVKLGRLPGGSTPHHAVH